MTNQFILHAPKDAINYTLITLKIIFQQKSLNAQLKDIKSPLKTAIIIFHRGAS